MLVSLSGALHAAEIVLPEPDASEPLAISAESASPWKQGAYDVWWLRGNVTVRQGAKTARAREGVVWIDNRDTAGKSPYSAIVYLEGDVAVEYQATAAGGGAVRQVQALAARQSGKKWLGRFSSLAEPTVRASQYDAEPRAKPAVYLRGEAERDPSRTQNVRRAQAVEPIDRPLAADLPPVGNRRVRIFPRSDVRPQFQLFPNDAAPGEWIAVVTQGVNVIVDGLEGFDSVDIKTDRAVMWAADLQKLMSAGQSTEASEMPLEIYLEGNIEFRQGDRVIEAQRMYYDVKRQSGVVLGAEARIPVPGYEGLVRLRADVLTQVDQQRFAAQNASITSSRLGVPTYDFRASNINFIDVQTPLADALTGAPAVDPATGGPLIDHKFLATSDNNFLYLGAVPVFYWPTLATDLERPTFYVKRVRFGNDSVFGFQTEVDLDAYELFGIANPPSGTDWEISAGYFSDRGPLAGTNFQYDREGLFNVPGRYKGEFDAWAINDEGTDNLGRGRRSLEPEEEFRGRVLARHRHYLSDGFVLSAEVGFISDRNFLEQYFEEEWDTLKDQTTGLELKQYRDNMSLGLAGDVRINEFFTQTQGGRLDHFWLGEPLFGDRFTWFEHSHIGYFDLEVADAPTDPTDAATFDLLPWEADRDGARASTRQEIDLPISAGPVKITPYALGEATYWGETLVGDEDTRLLGQVGVRTSLPLWSVNPLVENQFFNVHGLAHKVTFEADISYADANRDLEDYPLYDPLDDDSIEAFRRRFKFTTFGLPAGTPVPKRFDERFYALRSGLQNWVTSPSTEIADDLVAARLGVRQRWQTKRGMPDARRSVDWITLDAEAVIFPEEDRDNFGEEVGLARYDFRWFAGDRLTVVSEGGFDFFPDGPKYVVVGGYLNRPPRGSLYVGFHSLEGPISAEVLALAYSYRMSPKWVSTLGATYDFGDSGNIGQNLAVTKISESFLISIGVNVDASKGSVGASFLIEPRILARSRFGPAGGVLIPPAGAFGLE